MQPDMEGQIEEQYDKIYRYCYFKLGNAQLAEDITQETFLRSLEHARFQKDGYPLAYLYTVAKNLCIDEYRRKKPKDLEPELLERAFGMPESGEERLVDRISLKMALMELSEREREMILLRYVNEVPAAELAKHYGISRFTVYRETKRILKKLGRRIRNEAGQTDAGQTDH